VLIKLKRAGTFLFPIDDAGKAYFNTLQVGQEIEVDVADGESLKTAKQRGALHVWLKDLAQVLNDSGCDQRKFIEQHMKAGIDLPWTLHSVKECLYKPILVAMTGKESTEEMNTVEPSEVCKVLGARLSQKLGVTPPPFPTRFDQ
jgi:hypothetical protein